MRKCIICEKDPELVEFPPQGNKCRPCLAEYQREYRQKHPEKVKFAKRAQYLQNREEAKSKARENYWENREKRVAQKREYRAANPEKAREVARLSDAKSQAFQPGRTSTERS